MSELVNTTLPEITKQIREGEFETIFGINIWSRYDDDTELYQMLQFCKYVNKIGLTEWVDETFYDSKASLCFIKLIEIDEDSNCSYEIDAIRTMAALTIEQFELEGIIGHRNPYLSSAIKFQL
ncbi:MULTISPECIES: hypothetical protein [Acinetobacter]|uniref:Uncharacterized protein n=1 Tax=Acinetobacter higginsii TaxID=70347 RepID=N9T3C2_9GAMM|nr:MULTISPECIES: hypothetical protein [Acinetobacter]ENX58192.1 hypothetical protein F902_02592 [Acinetobacter higginsii]MCJ0829707.1 hypothetical protein [Acinetobacter sp. NIPH1876]